MADLETQLESLRLTVSEDYTDQLDEAKKILDYLKTKGPAQNKQDQIFIDGRIRRIQQIINDAELEETPAVSRMKGLKNKIQSKIRKLDRDIDNL